jgi:hypothetical protein
MRVAAAVATLSTGAAIRSGEVVRWRWTSTDLADMSQTALVTGTVIAVVGFLCCIREISKPLYGDGPWIWTLVAMVLYAAITAAVRVM